MSVASYIVAAVKFTLAITLPLPRCNRALRGLNRLRPSQMRLPMPRALLFAICGIMAMEGLCDMAVALAVMFVCYLRPCEVMRMMARHLVPPTVLAGPQYNSWGLVLHDASQGLGTAPTPITRSDSTPVPAARPLDL